MCLPTGGCREHWPDAATATCEALHPPDNCAAPTHDCSQAQCCDDPGFTCYQKDTYSHEARCMRGARK